jgi:hypothetical protein
MADKIGASPAERKRIVSDRMSKSQKLRNFYKKKSTKLGTLPAGSSIKGEKDKDLARLAKIKRESKAFEKTLDSKRKASQKQAEASDSFLASLRNDKYKAGSDFMKNAKKSKSKRGPKIGADMNSPRLKRMAGGGMVTSKYYSSGGKVFTGR